VFAPDAHRRMQRTYGTNVTYNNSGGYTCILLILPEEVMYQKKNEVNISDNIHIKMCMPINDII
jgi:hypothetical protein